MVMVEVYLMVLELLNPRQIRADLHLSRERMARLLDLSAKTVERMETAGGLPASSRVRDQLTLIQQIIDLGLRVYSPDGFAQFLVTPLPTFGGKTALWMIEQGQATQVLGALAAEYEGAGF